MAETKHTSAFPHDGTSLKFPDLASPGMSLRDWLAGQAMPAVMARMHEDIQHLGSPTFPNNVAMHSYRVADAMLAERSKP